MTMTAFYVSTVPNARVMAGPWKRIYIRILLQMCLAIDLYKGIGPIPGLWNTMVGLL